MVCGSDLVEMMGLFHDLAEAINELNIKKISELERYKIGYNNRVKREKKRLEQEIEGSIILLIAKRTASLSSRFLDD